jgi:hypothetical protein
MPDSEQVQPNRCRKWKVWVNDYNDIALEPSDSEHRKEIVVTELSAEHQADERVGLEPHEEWNEVKRQMVERIGANQADERVEVITRGPDRVPRWKKK